MEGVVNESSGCACYLQQRRVLVAATTAKNAYPDKKITEIRAEEIALVPCGIPYIFESIGRSQG